MIETFTRERAVRAAESWWSVMTWNDPGVALYAFGSTGLVQSEQHRADCLAYLEPRVGDAEDATDWRELVSLRRYIAAAPIEPYQQKRAA